MRILFGTHQLDAWAGSETYLLTLSEHVQQLGHETSVYAGVLGQASEEAARRGITVASSMGMLPSRPEAIIVQDAATAYALAAEFPRVPQLYVAHSEVHALQAPPQIPSLVQAIVVMNERVARRVQATAAAPTVVRLTQPVDLDRFQPGGQLPSRARRVLLLSNYIDGDRREMVLEACAAAGLEAVLRGAHVGSATADAAATIRDADVVIGQGRAIVETMACGRAAYVLDQRGSGGWVTGATYSALEDDGFAGVAQSAPVGRAELVADLEAYSADMGAVNRGLAAARHDARHHAGEVVGLLRQLAPPESRVGVPLREMSRLVLLQWQSWSREQALLRENVLLREGRDRAEAEYDVLTRAHAASLAELHELKHAPSRSQDRLGEAPLPAGAPHLGAALQERLIGAVRRRFP